MIQRGRRSAASHLNGYGNPQPGRASVASPRPPPNHLGEPERAIWGHVFEDCELPNRPSIAVLESALEAHQRARECREHIAVDGMIVTGRDGQTKPHPLLSVERDARAAWLAGIKALGLEL